MKIIKTYVDKSEKKKTHYCPVLDRQVDMSNCLEIRGIVGGEMIDVGGTDDGDYSKMYEVENYDEICQFDCQGLNLPFEKRRKSFFKNKKDYLKWKNSK